MENCKFLLLVITTVNGTSQNVAQNQEEIGFEVWLIIYSKSIP